MTTRSVLVMVLVFAGAASPAAADHGCGGTVTTVDAGPETLYIDDRSSRVGDINHWLYIESNDKAGLQTGGPWVLRTLLEQFPTPFDPCQHDNPDALIF